MFVLTFQVYLHHVIRNSSVHILRPFLGLSFVVMALLCALARYGLHYNHWPDVAVGVGLGVIMALYMVRHQALKWQIDIYVYVYVYVYGIVSPKVYTLSIHVHVYMYKS